VSNVLTRKIRSLNQMESRISGCTRCSELYRCCCKPSLGRGSLQADIIVVFPWENQLGRDRAYLKTLAQLLREKLKPGGEVYYSFLVRCATKLCLARREKSRLLEGKYITGDNQCVLSGQPCSIEPTEPGMEAVLNCLHYIVEEIAILEPDWIVTVGNLASVALLNTLGLLTADWGGVLGNQVFHHYKYGLLCLDNYPDIETYRQVIPAIPW